MAKVTAPLFSYDARGNIKKTIVYSFLKGVSVAKYYKKSSDPRTHAQQLQRGLYSEAVTAWNNLTDEQKAEYDQFIKGDILTGFNYFIKEFLLYNEIEEQYNFGYLISLFYGVHNYMMNPAFRDDLLMNLLYEN